MFRSIVSSLSLSPAATQHLAFYARRLKGENVTRRLSFVMAGALLLLQIATIIAPATGVNASSTNDIICGGINTSHPQKTLLDIYDANKDSCGHTGIRDIFTHYGITRANLANTTHGGTNSSNHSIKSLGRTPHSALDQTVIIGGQTYYQRPLYTWGDNVHYDALVGYRNDGHWFAVLYNCGNLAIVDTTPSTPNVNVTKTLVQGPPAGTAVTPGTLLTFRLGFNNSGNGPAANVVVGERLSDNTDYVSQSSLNIQGHTGGILAYHGYHSAYEGEPAGTFVYWKIDQLDAGGHGSADITVKVKPAAAPGSYLCDRGFIDTPSQSVEYSPGICHTVAGSAATPTVSTPPPTTTPPPPPVTPSSSNIVLSKSAILVSADGSKKDANNAIAQPGDIIEYTLSTKNTGQAAEKDYRVSENISDVLEYADVLDPRGGTVSGGIISWPKTTINPDQEFLTTFQVKVKNPLPSTPASVSDPQSFDLKMDNVYGNLVRVNLQPPNIGKQVETASSSLPQTGPATNVLTFAFIALVAYFYFRNRQLIREISMLRNEYHGVS